MLVVRQYPEGVVIAGIHPLRQAIHRRRARGPQLQSRRRLHFAHHQLHIRITDIDTHTERHKSLLKVSSKYTS